MQPIHTSFGVILLILTANCIYMCDKFIGMWAKEAKYVVSLQEEWRVKHGKVNQCPSPLPMHASAAQAPLWSDAKQH